MATPFVYLKLMDYSEYKTNDIIKLKCHCGEISELKFRRSRIDEYENYMCRSCKIKNKWQDKDYVNKRMSAQLSGEEISKRMAESGANKIIAKKAKAKWDNKEYRNKQKKIRSSDKFIKEQSRRSRGIWVDENRRKALKEKMKARVNDDYRNKRSKKSKELWTKEEYVKKTIAANRTKENKIKLSVSSKKAWADKQYRSKQAVNRANQSGKISNIQEILYSILDDLGIKYYREYENKPNNSQCIIGPYNFDCVVPRDGKPDLLIECQGNYWHSLKSSIRNDKAKATYVEKYKKASCGYIHPDQRNEQKEWYKYGIPITNSMMRD